MLTVDRVATENVPEAFTKKVLEPKLSLGNREPCEMLQLYPLEYVVSNGT